MNCCRWLCFGLALLNVCGAIPNPKSGIKIVGGDEADIKDFPYQAALLLENGNQSCGAALVRDDTVITAAHCVLEIKPNTSISLRFGSSKWNSGGQVVAAKEIISHEHYSNYNMDNDIAIIKLAIKVNTENASPIPLASANSTYSAGTLAVVTGWGLLSPNGESPETLRKVEVPIVEASICRKTYGDALTKRMICAGYKEGGKDSCQKDSGGPLVVNDKLVGVVSFGRGCGLPNVPGVYTFIPAFKDWIKQNADL